MPDEAISRLARRLTRAGNSLLPSLMIALYGRKIESGLVAALAKILFFFLRFHFLLVGGNDLLR